MGMGWCSYCCKLFAGVILQRAYDVAIGAVGRGGGGGVHVKLLQDAIRRTGAQRAYDVAGVGCGAAYLYCCC